MYWSSFAFYFTDAVLLLLKVILALSMVYIGAGEVKFTVLSIDFNHFFSLQPPLVIMMLSLICFYFLGVIKRFLLTQAMINSEEWFERKLIVDLSLKKELEIEKKNELLTKGSHYFGRFIGSLLEGLLPATLVFSLTIYLIVSSIYLLPLVFLLFAVAWSYFKSNRKKMHLINDELRKKSRELNKLRKGVQSSCPNNQIPLMSNTGQEYKRIYAHRLNVSVYTMEIIPLVFLILLFLAYFKFEELFKSVEMLPSSQFLFYVILFKLFIDYFNCLNAKLTNCIVFYRSFQLGVSK